MSERRIRLDIAVGGHAEHQSAHSGAGDGRNSAGEEHVDRFRQALTGGGKGNVDGAKGSNGADGAGGGADAAAGSSGGSSPPQARLRGAFDLFGRGAGRSAAGAQPPGGTEALLAGAGTGMAAAMLPGVRTEDSIGGRAGGGAGRFACQMAERILVSADGQHEARIFIRDDVLPGVELRVHLTGGRWAVEFTVTDAGSFALIEEAGDQIAGTLAARLRSGVEVQLTRPGSSRAGIELHRRFLADPPPGGDGT